MAVLVRHEAEVRASGAQPLAAVRNLGDSARGMQARGLHEVGK
jgi:hypothetical protein